MQRRIYLDNAATTWPKPQSVVSAISDYYEMNGASAGRGASVNSAGSDRILEQVRIEIGQRIGVSNHKQIVFTSNATDGLNMVIQGWLQPGDYAVATKLEHNSVARPLYHQEAHRQVQVDWIDCQPDGLLDLDLLASTFKTKQPQLFCFSAVSNVTGVIQPLEEISKLCAQWSVPSLCDAAQALGHIDERLAACQFDFVASSGHKGLHGPQGTGFLYVGEKAGDRLLPVRQGGTGQRSEQKSQPADFPFRLESGTQNVGGIAGLLAGLQFLKTDEAKELHQRRAELAIRLRNELGDIDNVLVYPTARNNVQQTEIVSFNIDGFEPQSVAAILESSFGIEVRAGFHCSPLMHESLGTISCGGAVRVSPGLFNSENEIDTLVTAIQQIAQSIKV